MPPTAPQAELVAPVRPEALLDRFNRVLCRLHASAAVLGDRRAGQLTHNLLRKTLTAQLISESYLVAVAGMQGAGKTTLVRQLYALGYEWLPENLGIGERLPVFIIENTKLARPRGFAIELGDVRHGTSLLRTVEVDGDAWLDGLRGRRDQLIARLEVPARVFEVDGAGILLLPGFEPYGEREWQTLMHQALIASPSTVVVADPSHLASPAARDIMDKMREQYLAGRHPIVVISHCEGMSDQGKEEVRRAAASAFRVPLDAGTCDVIPCGVTEESRAVWQPMLVDALRENARSGEQARRKQVRHLQEMVNHDGADLLDFFTEGLEAWRASNESTSEEYGDQLRCFDEEARTLAAGFQRLINEVLDRQLEGAKGNMRKYLEDQEGWKGVAQRLIVLLSIGEAAKQRELDLAIKNAWKNAQRDFSGEAQQVRDDAVARVLGYLADAVDVQPEVPQRNVGVSQSEDDVTTTDRDSPSGEPPHASLDELVHKVGDLARLGLDENAVVTPQAMRLLPVIAYELMTFSVWQGASVAALEPAADAEQWASVLTDLSRQRYQLLTALVGFVGVDIAADTEVHSITALAKALHAAFNPTLSAGAAVSAAAASAAGALLGITSIAVMLNYANRSDVARQRALESLLQAVRDQQWMRLDAAFEHSMRQMRAIIAARLRIYYNVDVEHERIWSLQKVISDFRQSRLDLLEACGADLTALG